MSLLQTIIIAIIEGLTEFLPISSTGHMILASSLMGIQDSEFTKTFEIVIQLGAIFAVLILYIKRLLAGIDIYLKLGIAFIPTAIIGIVAYKTIKAYLFNPLVVSLSLIIGGIVLLFIDKWIKPKNDTYVEIKDLSYLDCFKIGLFQCISMIPGVSRAAATIIGGMVHKLDRNQAAEFSFLLAIPTMFAASGKDLMESMDLITAANLQTILIGSVIAFITALFAVKGFVAFLTKYDFKPFGYYRIVIGVAFLIYAYSTGLSLSTN
ncbi:MAG: undecaprenyl-diphosphate phosphatase [Bacteroidetes bacterium]|nr:undecaprenyl-diphosphate phosphatase [Bacteroidota bacterium]